MNQPSKETKLLLAQLIRRTSLPIILEEIKNGKDPYVVDTSISKSTNKMTDTVIDVKASELLKNTKVALRL